VTGVSYELSSYWKQQPKLSEIQTSKYNTQAKHCCCFLSVKIAAKQMAQLHHCVNKKAVLSQRNRMIVTACFAYTQ